MTTMWDIRLQARRNLIREQTRAGVMAEKRRGVKFRASQTHSAAETRRTEAGRWRPAPRARGAAPLNVDRTTLYGAAS